jgi:hypothetical protein
MPSFNMPPSVDASVRIARPALRELISDANYLSADIQRQWRDGYNSGNVRNPEAL